MKFKYPGKLGQSLLFEEFHFRHPVTMRWASVDDFRSFVSKGGVLSHDLPFFIKANESHEGTGVFVITGPQTLEDVLEKLSSWEQTGQWGFVSQELIPCEGNVLRSVILGKQIITYWKRPEKPGQLVTSVSRNALVDKTWKKALQKKGQLRAKGFSEVTGINLAAIDFLFSFTEQEPEPLFLEINYYFGRRGLGGSLNYYRLLHKAILEWLSERGFDPDPLQLL